jgi:prepilin-type processing-associated H-X9-DG protein
MKHRTLSTKIDLVVALVCILFLIANIAAVGEIGRKRAQDAVCLSNLLKWGQIFQAYTADNDGYFNGRTPGANYYMLWPYVYKPYYNDKMMRFCPTAINPERVWGPFGTWKYLLGSFRPLPNYPMNGESEYNLETGRVDNGHFTGSYGLNRFIENMGGSFATDPAFWRRAGVKGGDKVPVLLDSQYLTFSVYTPATEPPDCDGCFDDNEMQWICINRHTGYVNAVFLDFSARKVGLKELWTLKHSRTFDTCGPWTKCGGGEPNDWPEWMRGFQDY